jgi:propane 2-monooxygenase large subunit
VSRASVTKSHQKIQELSWDPTFVSPLKQVLRSYFSMEEEKDNRVFGARAMPLTVGAVPKP